MAIVYGDSTPFPYGDNFIEITADLIDCCVALFDAQHMIELSAAAIVARELHRKTERGRLEAFTDAVRGAVTSAIGDHARRLVAPVFEAAKALIDRESAELEAQSDREVAQHRAQAEEARASTHRILEAFLLKHTLPGTLSELRLLASERGYVTKLFQVTPFGVEALFVTAVPPQSDWARHRRVGDINPGTEVQMSLAAGWLSKRMELQAVRLDKLFISEVSLREEQSKISVRKAATSGGGYLLEVISGPPPRVALAALGEDGLPTETARILDDDDYIHGLRLWSKLAPSTHGLNRKQAMLSATVNKKPLQELDTPEAIGLRLIQILAPILKEIAKRSLAPGELILRRDLGGGRREELYATKAEFFEKLKDLPEKFQRYFDPLELSAPGAKQVAALPQSSPKQVAVYIPLGSGAPVASPSGQSLRSAPVSSPSPTPGRNAPVSSPSPAPKRSVPISSPSPAPLRNVPTASPSGRLVTQGAPTLVDASSQSAPQPVPVSARSMPTLIIDPSLSMPIETILELAAISDEAIAALLDEAPPHTVIPPSYITQETTAVSPTVASFEAVSFDEEAFRDLEDSTPIKR